MKRKAMIPLVLGLTIGLFTVKLAVDAIQKARAANGQVQTIKVVRAATEINAYESLGQAMLEVVETNDSALVPEAERFNNIEDLEGRVSAKAIPRGSPVLSSMLAPLGTPPGLPGQIPKGHCAMSVKIDEVTGVAYQIQPGDWVDVVVVMDIDTGVRGKKETVSEVILQNVQVAAIGHTSTAQAGESTGQVKPAKSATLFIRNRDRAKLHLANKRGAVALVLRSNDGSVDDATLSADMSDVLPGFRPKKESGGSTGVSPLMAALGFGQQGATVESSPVDLEPVPLPEPGPQGAAPLTVLVVRGGSSAENMQNITFKDGKSPNIIAFSRGATGSAIKDGGTQNTPRNMGIGGPNLNQKSTPGSMRESLGG